MYKLNAKQQIQFNIGNVKFLQKIFSKVFKQSNSIVE